MGHEYCGIVEEVGSAVKTMKQGQFVIGSFFASDNTCPHCNFGYQSSCQQREFVGGAQAPLLRVPLADGTLVPTPGVPAKEMIPGLLATSEESKRDPHDCFAVGNWSRIDPGEENDRYKETEHTAFCVDL
jgi:hypothetical protein